MLFKVTSKKGRNVFFPTGCGLFYLPDLTELTFSVRHTHPFSPLALLSGDVQAAVDVLEEVFTKPGSNFRMTFVFRKVLEDGNEPALDKRKTREKKSGHSSNGSLLLNEHKVK